MKENKRKRKELRGSTEDKSSERPTLNQTIVGRQTEKKKTRLIYSMRGKFCCGKCVSVVALSFKYYSGK